MANDLADPGEEEVGLEVEALANPPPDERLGFFETRAVSRRLLADEGIDREDEPLALVLLDLRRAQLLAQATLPQMPDWGRY